MRSSASSLRRSALLCSAVLSLLGAGACSNLRESSSDDEATLASLSKRDVEVAPQRGIKGSREQAIDAYRSFLDIAPRAALRAEAVRRLGDLEMDSAERSAGNGQGKGDISDYRAAIKHYQEFLEAYPNDPNNGRVLYQLARAQEQGGALEGALQTLDRLVREFANSPYRDEAQFRRGELLFTVRDYAKAEQAYSAVLSSGARSYHERALYMQGWAVFKQGRLEEALYPFFGVLDAKLGSADADDAPLEALPNLTRADRELVEDTFRVMSLCLANLRGAESIAPYIDTRERRGYEFRVYQNLGELYLRQDRSKDAADTLAAFARHQPLHAQAPVLQARVIDIYQRAGFATLAMQAKKEYVQRYGASSELRQANPAGWERAQALVKTHLAELARHYHASAQKSKASADYEEAVRWYRAYIASFPHDPAAAQHNFLLAELLFDNGQLAQAAVEYERTAYAYPLHVKSADAAYSALLSYAGQEKGSDATRVAALQRTAVRSAQQFAARFPADARNPTVLSNAAEKLFALGDVEQASQLAELVLELRPAANPAQRRIAWTVIAHAAFEGGSFDKAEKSYTEVLALTPANDALRQQLVERLAACAYKQGEQARAAGRSLDAVAHFNRVATLAPMSAVRATAQFDAATVLIGLKDWDSALHHLEDFRQRYPKHPLQDEVGGKLAVAYLESGHFAKAAGEFERLAATHNDPHIVRGALWQAAELHDRSAGKAADRSPNKSAARAAAAKAYERYVRQFPEPLEPALEARAQIARLAKDDGDTAREFAAWKDIFLVERSAGKARTDRSRTLGGMAALVVAQSAFDAYRKVALIEPLQKQLKLKKAKMEEVMKAYGVATEYGVAEVTTAATFHTASLYSDFGKALMDSQRPRKLSKAELEQYNVMLEEQAFPFEEKASELHEVNARRSADGHYDQWVKSSFAALGELRPLRYRKAERSEVSIDAIR
ncbi:MAG: tetratricopeptide repeat protein [Burkholderiaceae bacterium]